MVCASVDNDGLRLIVWPDQWWHLVPVVTEAAPGAASAFSAECSDPEFGASEVATAGASESKSMVVDERDNQLDELVRQPLLVGQSSEAEEKVLDTSPSHLLPGDCVLEASAMAGVPQEEVLDSSPSFSPLSGTVLSSTPSPGVTVGVDGAAGDGSASLVADSRVLRSRILVKVGRAGGSGDSQPTRVSLEETARMVQKLKATLRSSTDDIAGVLLSLHVPLPCLFLPGSALVLARGWLFLRPLVPGPVPGTRGLP